MPHIVIDVPAQTGTLYLVTYVNKDFVFLLFLGAPILAGKVLYKSFSEVQARAALGIYGYMVICFADGAIMLIPVLAIFFFVAPILLEAPRLFGLDSNLSRA